MQIIPTILENNSADFLFQLKNIGRYFHHFQIDIGDGIFVPNKTLNIDEVKIAMEEQCNNKTVKQLTFDFHLMVKNYKNDIEKIKLLSKKIRVKNILIHASLQPDIEYLITNNSHFSFGLVLDPEDQVGTLVKNYDLAKIPIIQIMTVNPGFQGSPFRKDLLNKIEQLRLKDYRYKIFIDGGVNEKTIPVILKQKFLPDALCVGSYLTKANNNLNERINYLKSV